MKHYFLSALSALIFAASGLSAAAQNTVWHNPFDPEDVPAEGSGYIHGRGFAPNNYGRLPGEAKGKVRDAVWGLSQNSAGLYIRFMTDSPEITVQYEVTGGHAMPHMPATGVSGVDLYSPSGERCWGDYSFGTPITYTYKGLTPSEFGEYTLYLPLYNTVKWLKVGVPSENPLAFVPADTAFSREQQPIVVYGTSIAQGACASRPGMAWTNILHRTTGRPVVNLGFSGNGRLEPEVIDYVASIPASVYVVDCMPNMYVSEDSVCRLVVDAVRRIRSVRPQTPILLVEHPGYANGGSNVEQRSKDEYPDRAQRKAYAQLRKERVKNLHYLSREELTMPADGMVDHIHPTDYGMEAYAAAYRIALGKILKLK